MNKVLESIVEQTFNELAIKVVTQHLTALDTLAAKLAEQKKATDRLIASFK